MTQDQVVAQLQLMGIEISKSTYAKLETNRMNIKVSELIALSKIFDTDIAVSSQFSDRFLQNSSELIRFPALPNSLARTFYQPIDKIRIIVFHFFCELPGLKFRVFRFENIEMTNFHPVFCRFSMFQGAKEKPQKRDVSEVYLYLHILFDYLLLNRN